LTYNNLFSILLSQLFRNFRLIEPSHAERLYYCDSSDKGKQMHYAFQYIFLEHFHESILLSAFGYLYHLFYHLLLAFQHFGNENIIFGNEKAVYLTFYKILKLDPKEVGILLFNIPQYEIHIISVNKGHSLAYTSVNSLPELM